MGRAEYEEGELTCPRCGSKEVEQTWSAFYAITSNKSAGERMPKEDAMHFEHFSFGTIRIDDSTYDNDVIIDRGKIRERKKKPSKKFRDDFGHTPLSIAEDIPWKCRQLVIGTGAYGRLPIMKEVKRKAKRHKVKLRTLPTTQAIRILEENPENTNAILHVTC